MEVLARRLWIAEFYDRQSAGDPKEGVAVAVRETEIEKGRMIKIDMARFFIFSFGDSGFHFDFVSIIELLLFVELGTLLLSPVISSYH